jgi:hypothetical protein
MMNSLAGSGLFRLLPSTADDESDQSCDSPDREQNAAEWKREIGIPDQKTEIVERLSIILAADRARDRVIEIFSPKS